MDTGEAEERGEVGKGPKLFSPRESDARVFSVKIRQQIHDIEFVYVSTAEHSQAGFHLINWKNDFSKEA